MDTHFTAVIEVSKTEAEKVETDKHGYNPVTIPRKVVEVVRIVVRANSIESLKAKIVAHTELMDGV